MKTSELIGDALDWAVCVCEGESPSRYTRYSTEWAHGGPIIERERIDLYFIGHDAVDNGLPIWRAEKLGAWGEEGPTPLVAAMRCYVASVLGAD
jgi:hypothetical protein